MDPAQWSRLRRAAGYTLLGVSSVLLVYCVVLAGSPPPCCGENWNPIGALGIAILVAGPTLLAAIGVLRGRVIGAIVGGVVSLTYALPVTVIVVLALTSQEPTNPADHGELLAFVALAAAYFFAGLASLLTVNAR